MKINENEIVKAKVYNLINDQQHFTAYSVGKNTNISSSLIGMIRQGRRSIDNLKLKNAIELANYYDSKMNQSSK